MPNAKILICTMPTADRFNHSATGTLHIHTTVPHACSKKALPPTKISSFSE